MSSDKMIWQMKMIRRILSMQRDMGCPESNERTLRVEYNYEEIWAIYASTYEQHRAWLARQVTG